MSDTEPVIPEKYFPQKLVRSVERVRSQPSDIWPVDGLDRVTGIGSYSQEFTESLQLLGYIDLLDLIKNIKAAHGSAHILDVMGGGYFIQPDE